MEPADEVLSFEAALERLESLVSNLDKGDMSLEDSLQAFEEGVRLSRHCAQKLADAEQRIEVLLSESNELSRVPYEVDDEEG